MNTPLPQKLVKNLISILEIARRSLTQDFKDIAEDMDISDEEVLSLYHIIDDYLSETEKSQELNNIFLTALESAAPEVKEILSDNSQRLLKAWDEKGVAIKNLLDKLLPPIPPAAEENKLMGIGCEGCPVCAAEDPEESITSVNRADDIAVLILGLKCKSCGAVWSEVYLRDGIWYENPSTEADSKEKKNEK